MQWNKYRSQMNIQPQNNNFNYLIDPKDTKVNRLFVLSFPRIARENNTTKVLLLRIECLNKRLQRLNRWKKLV